MRIIVVGNGKVGKVIVGQLVKEGHDIVVIDNNPARIAEAQNDYDVMCVCGNGACRSVQMEARAQEADILIAVTAVDEVNLLCCLIAKKLGAKKTVARVRNPDYADELPMIRDVLELDMVINPELATARDIFSVLRFPGLLTVEKFGKGRVELAELRITEDSPLAGLTLNEINRRFKVRVLICAVRRGSETFIPNGDFVLLAGDNVSFTAGPEQAIRFLRYAGIPVKPPKNVIIVGGGRVTHYLTKMLQTINVRPVIIESSYEKCQALSAAFPDSLIIRGDGADRDLLREENAGDMDMLIALTGDEESNVLISLLAKELGTRRTITRVSKLSYMHIVSAIGLDTVINPRMSAVRAILQHLRRGRIISVAPLREEQAEVIEAEALETSDIVNTPLAEVNFPPGAILGAVVRAGEIIIPRGDTIVLPHDRLIIFALQQVVNQLEKLLTVKLEYF